MIDWQAEPLWQTLAALQAMHQLQAGDVLRLSLTEQARVVASRRRRYRGLDMLKSQLRTGTPGVIIRLRP